MKLRLILPAAHLALFLSEHVRADNYFLHHKEPLFSRIATNITLAEWSVRILPLLNMQLLSLRVM
jgi:hypothetical protein